MHAHAHMPTHTHKQTCKEPMHLKQDMHMSTSLGPIGVQNIFTVAMETAALAFPLGISSAQDFECFLLLPPGLTGKEKHPGGMLH